jgi:hypothetical protein
MAVAGKTKPFWRLPHRSLEIDILHGNSCGSFPLLLNCNPSCEFRKRAFSLNIFSPANPSLMTYNKLRARGCDVTENDPNDAIANLSLMTYNMLRARGCDVTENDPDDAMTREAFRESDLSGCARSQTRHVRAANQRSNS